MSAYRKNDNGNKFWLIDNKYGGWVLQYRPNKNDVDHLVGDLLEESDDDTHIYSIKVKEIERKSCLQLRLLSWVIE